MPYNVGHTAHLNIGEPGCASARRSAPVRSSKELSPDRRAGGRATRPMPSSAFSMTQATSSPATDRRGRRSATPTIGRPISGSRVLCNRSAIPNPRVADKLPAIAWLLSNRACPRRAPWQARPRRGRSTRPANGHPPASCMNAETPKPFVYPSSRSHVQIVQRPARPPAEPRKRRGSLSSLRPDLAGCPQAPRQITSSHPGAVAGPTRLLSGRARRPKSGPGMTRASDRGRGRTAPSCSSPVSARESACRS
jgi:hypothetical protein